MHAQPRRACHLQKDNIVKEEKEVSIIRGDKLVYVTTVLVLK